MSTKREQTLLILLDTKMSTNENKLKANEYKVSTNEQMHTKLGTNCTQMRTNQVYRTNAYKNEN